MSVRHDQQDLKYWHTWGEFPHECFVIRRFTLPNLSEYSAPLKTFNSKYGTEVGSSSTHASITLFERGIPEHARAKRRIIWTGPREEFKIAIQGGGEFYELGLYGLQGPVREVEWNYRVASIIAEVLIKGGAYEPPPWTISEEPLSNIRDRDLFGHSMVPV